MSCLSGAAGYLEGYYSVQKGIKEVAEVRLLY